MQLFLNMSHVSQTKKFQENCSQKIRLLSFVLTFYDIYGIN